MVDSPVAVNTSFMREVNSAAILASLRSQSSVSIAALARATSLSRQAVRRSLDVMAQRGLVEFLPPDRSVSRPGRPGQLIRFRAEVGYVLGISVDTEEIRVVLADLVGTTVASAIKPLPMAALETLRATVGEVLDSGGVRAADIWHCTVGAPGIVDPAAGYVRYIPSMPEITGDVIVRTLREMLPCAAYLDNNLKLATEGERWHSTEHNDRFMVLIYWGERVGAGIVLDGELYRGASNDAGDIGFLDLFSGDGSEGASQNNTAPRGQFEEWVGWHEFIRVAIAAARRRDDDELADQLAGTSRGLDLLIASVHAGNPAALEATDEVARRFVKGISALRAILDPSLVVIGGPMARLGEELLATIRRHLDRERLNQPQIEFSNLGDDAVVQGAIHHSLLDISRERWKLPPASEDLPAPTHQQHT